MELRILSVNVGKPRPIGMQGGIAVLSAFGKNPVQTGDVEVRSLGLEGDAQADLQAHGGVDKAVYAFSSDNWTWWETKKRFACGIATFGENLTLEGGVETDMRIGDRFRWGDALLEISQPRSPCFKFQLFSGRDDAAALMSLSGQCGWYFRVLQEGAAPTQTTCLTRVFESDGPNVRETFFAAIDPRIGAERRRQIADVPALSNAWRMKLRRRGTKAGLDG